MAKADLDTVPPITFMMGLFLVFLHLKLSGSIDWSWWFIFTPLIVRVTFTAVKSEAVKNAQR